MLPGGQQSSLPSLQVLLVVMGTGSKQGFVLEFPQLGGGLLALLEPLSPW